MYPPLFTIRTDEIILVRFCLTLTEPVAYGL